MKLQTADRHNEILTIKDVHMYITNPANPPRTKLTSRGIAPGGTLLLYTARSAMIRLSLCFIVVSRTSSLVPRCHDEKGGVVI